MTHATSWNSQATGEAPSSRDSALGVRSDSLRRRPSGRSGGELGLSLVAGVPAEGASLARGQAHAGTTPAIGQEAEAPTCNVAGTGRAPCGVPDGALDAAAGSRTDSPRVRGSVPPGACLDGADRAGLELPEAGAPGRRAGRGRHRPVETGRLAPDKKTSLDVAPISSSSMRVDSCSFPTSAGPGRPKGRRRACVTGTVTIASRSVAGWWSRPNGDASRSTSGVARALSAVSTSARSSNTSSGICGALSTCSGTAARSIDGMRSPRSSPPIRGCTFITFRLTPRSSIRPSTCGPRRTRHSPMALPMTCATSAIAWTMRRDDSAARRISCGPASTHRISRGLGESSIIYAGLNSSSKPGSAGSRPSPNRAPCRLTCWRRWHLMRVPTRCRTPACRP